MTDDRTILARVETDERTIRDRLIAEILLDASSSAQYLLHRLRDIDERWADITNGALMKLGRKYTAVIVLQAIGYARTERSTPADPYPFLEAICVRIENEGAA